MAITSGVPEFISDKREDMRRAGAKGVEEPDVSLTIHHNFLYSIIILLSYIHFFKEFQKIKIGIK